MPARISYDFYPDPDEFAHAMWNVSDALRDPRLPLLFAAAQTREEIVESFETKTSPDGEPWKPWSEKYEPEARRRGNIDVLRGPEELLYRAATDRNCFVINGDTLFYDASRWPTTDSGEDSYGWFHQEGAPHRKTEKGKPNPLPKREFVGVSAEGEAAVFAAFAGWFDKSLALYETSVGSGIGVRGRNPLGQFETTNVPMSFTAGSRG